MFSRHILSAAVLMLSGVIFKRATAALPAAPSTPPDNAPPSLASCIQTKLAAWIRENPGPSSAAFEAKRQEIFQTCGQLTHQNVYDLCDANDSQWLSGKQTTKDFLKECQ